jgi:hypothetical protein
LQICFFKSNFEGMSIKPLIMSENLYESYFELNLNFQGHKNPSDAFKQIGNMFDKLNEIDKFVLYNI